MKLKFYDVDKDYINYLQNSEIEERGFTCVPNMEYGNRQQKFLCGIVLKVNNFNYYVPVSSYKKQQSENVLIKFKGDASNQIKGSLRFNYMIPVPNECIFMRNIQAEPNQTRRIFLEKQLKYINKISGRVRQQAKRTYTKVTQNFNEYITNHSCDFSFLEQKCLEYESALNSDMKAEENFDQPNIEDDLEL